MNILTKVASVYMIELPPDQSHPLCWINLAHVMEAAWNGKKTLLTIKMSDGSTHTFTGKRALAFLEAIRNAPPNNP